MTDTPTTPPAGWYPAPDGSAATWWWDGTQWVEPQVGVAPAPASTGGIAKLAIAVQVLLIACGALSVITIGIELLGISATTDFISGRTSAVDQIDTYDVSSSTVSLLWTIVFIATGVLWVIWQYRAAKQVARHTRRSPGWHAGSWFIPVISFWFPYQNISDLWKALGKTVPPWLIAWWVLWLASNAMIQVTSRAVLAAEELEEFRTAMYLSIVSELLSVAAVPLALLVVRGITRGILERPAAPAQSPTLLPTGDPTA